LYGLPVPVQEPSLISRVDGIKILVLAWLVAAFCGGRSGRRVALTIISAAAVQALLVFGIGDLTLMPALMSAANVSLPLLLIWALAAMAARVSEFRAPIAADICDRNSWSSWHEHNRA
jgi:hypothetical protein